MDDMGLGSIHWLCVVGSLQERGQCYSVLLVCSVIPEHTQSCGMQSLCSSH